MTQTTVAEIRRETPDAVTVRLDLGGQSWPYRPGQYLEIDPHQFDEIQADVEALEKSKGLPESPRAFSLSSDGMDPGFLEISVKLEKPGRFPPLLTPFIVHRLAVGRSVSIEGPSGQYCLPEAPPAASGFLHLCAGSGVAPNRGMIRHALARGWPQKHLLLLQNRTPDDVFYRGEWPELLSRYGDRFRLQHVFSVTDGQHVSPELVRSAMEGYLEPGDSLACVCGPNRPREVVLSDGRKERHPGFCERWTGNPRRKIPGVLESLGFSSSRILTEMW